MSAGSHLPRWNWILLQYHDLIGEQKQGLVKVRASNVPYLVVMVVMSIWIFLRRISHNVHEGHLHIKSMDISISSEVIVEYVSNITMHAFIHNKYQ